MRRLIVAALVVTAFSAKCERTAGAGNVTAQVLEFGAFELGPGKPGSREVHFTSHDRVIVPRLGSGFGFRFRLNNVPDGESIELKTFVTHPPIRDRNGETRTQYALLTTIPVKNGSATSMTGYSFDRPEEMTPGEWMFEHSFRGKTLVKQSFIIRASDTGAPPHTP